MLSLVTGGMAMLGSVVPIIAAGIGAILTPIGLTVVALGGLAAYLVHVGDVGKESIDFLLAGFNLLKADVTKALGGIADALKAGDLALAAKIFWALIKVEWTQGINWLSEKTDFITSYWRDAWTSTQQFLSEFLLKAWGGLQIVWNEITGAMNRAWVNLCEGISHTWGVVQDQLEKGWTYVKSLFDDGIDVDAEFKRIDDASKQRGGGAVNAKIDAINAQLDATNARILKETEGNLQSLKTQNAAQDKQRAEARKNAVADAKAELAAARKEFDAAVGEAKAKREALDGKTPDRKAPDAPVVPDLGNMRLAAEGLAGVSGTFSAAVAARIADSSMPAKQLQELKTINANLEQIKDKGGAKFAP
ncbi:MAG: hypothetical protein QM811_16905 [Pirellulales bacterium]